ncbi:MAG: beta-lactamase family protein [Chitinispirillaceae bacterium]|nr:beta-lactamase family protein [Chitinispirillaceae bacterium]
MTKKLLCGLCVVIFSSFNANVYAGHHKNNFYLHQNNLHSDKRKIKQFESVMDEYIAQQMETNDASGLSIVVVDNNRVIYQKGFGFADKENSVVVTDSTLFHIGSITKLFTGIGIMQLAQKGLINIDAPIQHYLPEFSVKYHKFTRCPITVRSMMAHQSGLFGDKQSNSLDFSYPSEDYRMYPEFAKNEYAAYHPNTITSYSNFAVSLLGLIIERVSGKKYEKYIYDNILAPCGMLESSFDPLQEHESLFAKGYDANGELRPYIYYAGNPAGSLASSSSNMANLIKMVLDKGKVRNNWILSPFTLNYMYTPHSIFLPLNLLDRYYSPYNFGLSWMLESESFDYLGKVIGHGGNIVQYNSKLLIAKDVNLGIFVTVNKQDFYPDQIAYFGLVKAAEIFRNLKKPDLPDVPHQSAVPDFHKKFIKGSYCVLRDIPGDLYFENDTLYFHQAYSERIPMVYHTDDWFSFYLNGSVIPGVRLGVRFLNGQKVLCAENRDDFSVSRMVFGNALSKKDTIPGHVSEKLGVYFDAASGYPVLNLFIDSLPQSKIKLLTALSLEDNMPLILKPAENNTFIIQGMGRGAQETVYFTGDTANYSGYKFVKLQDMSESTTRMRSSVPDAAVKSFVKFTQPEDVINNLKKAIKKSSLL